MKKFKRIVIFLAIVSSVFFLLSGAPAVASQYPTYDRIKVANVAITGPDSALYKICRNNIQWLYLAGAGVVADGYQGGLAKDEEWIDIKDPSKGTKPIYCNF